MLDKLSLRSLGAFFFLFVPLSTFAQASVVSGGGDVNQHGVGGIAASVGQVAFSSTGAPNTSLSEVVRTPGPLVPNQVRYHLRHTSKYSISI